ncbi:MAG: hypothetical protein EOP49_27170, partial [Sphingobacteriales bacterium]
MTILKYSSKERLIGALIIPPIAVVLNCMLFGSAYFKGWPQFFWPLLITMATVLVIYTLCSMVAVILLNHFPLYSQTFKRIGIGIACYVIIMVIAITILFFGYDYIRVMGLNVKMGNYPWVLVTGITCNLLATSFNEGASFYEKWRKLVDEA